MIVLDTSALVELLVGDDALGEAVRAAVTGQRLAAPHAVDLECAATLRGLVRGNKLAPDKAEQALVLLARMPLQRYDHVRLLPRIWELRHNMWPYDAAYAALAEALRADLITLDKRIAAAPGLRCTVRDLRS
ncbi:type II toxin-antitoxin system VapC family toxin [Streptomyces alkaliterrae]|uniref:Ribonuclease VapC n=1 Tax=Streptomyces alkaliterrae TaxID=2213162 RepID=A0A5P0YSD5_9ACTN|nr:type II toxin-antitoxin system VapC family toxin [Streptomyces alkaliterrae]MBB1257574.1 type II toxin-antitoxin system VapC family toxin [Streptomyces alkaliterrae]MQS02800.1 PIN domain-containing protein [Streptomyces alkaliterrae]